ncbi:phosphate signaling complex protein PhoU [Corynebacterium sp. 335C]
MRTVYREQMDSFAHDLIIMCDHIHGMNTLASTALFDADIDAAEEVLSSLDRLEELRSKCENQAFELLAREAPVARDLRQVVSGIYIVEDMSRMGTLSVHVANTARRRHPDKVLPEELEGYFREMSRVCGEMTRTTHDILVTYDVDAALQLNTDDDQIDDIHQRLLAQSVSDDWPHSSRVTVDTTLLSRFYERYADHAVAVASQIVYLASGYKPEQLLLRREVAQEDEIFEARIHDLERHFRK